jgi:uncharacterized membrane protein
MAVFQEQDSGGFRYEVRPNCALSWRWTKRLFWFFACCLAAVAAYFASVGAWLVLPFAGLELAVLGAGLYLSALAGHTREVIEVGEAGIKVLRGRRNLAEVARFPAYWTLVALRRDPRGWYPSRLLLTCHGMGIEIGAKLVETEREALASSLEKTLGFGRLPGDRAASEATCSGGGSPASPGHPIRALCDASAHAMTVTPSASKDTGAAGCARGAYREKREDLWP